jgi:transcriptional regulator with XRE-family HTH domain
MQDRGLSNSEVAIQAGISRQTWYNLLNADIKEAKLSTIINIAKVFDVHPYDLMALYFGTGSKYKKHEK